MQLVKFKEDAWPYKAGEIRSLEARSIRLLKKRGVKFEVVKGENPVTDPEPVPVPGKKGK